MTDDEMNTRVVHHVAAGEKDDLYTVVEGSERHRLECEARSVCAMPEYNDRNRYMKRVKEMRGDAAFFELAEAVREQWRLKNERVS